MRNRHSRGMAIAFFVMIISYFNFTNLSGTECIRAIHIVTLLVAGMGIGVFITNFFGWLRYKRTNPS